MSFIKFFCINFVACLHGKLSSQNYSLSSQMKRCGNHKKKKVFVLYEFFGCGLDRVYRLSTVRTTPKFGGKKSIDELVDRIDLLRSLFFHSHLPYQVYLFITFPVSSQPSTLSDLLVSIPNHIYLFGFRFPNYN